MNRIRHEPRLEDLLNDPTLHILMWRDGVSEEDLCRVVDSARHSLSRFSGRDRDDAGDEGTR